MSTGGFADEVEETYSVWINLTRMDHRHIIRDHHSVSQHGYHQRHLYTLGSLRQLHRGETDAVFYSFRDVSPASHPNGHLLLETRVHITH